MKFWTVFVVLKLLEISGIVFVPHFLGKAICKKFPNIQCGNQPPFYIVGSLGVLIIILILLVGISFVEFNLELTEYFIK